MCVYIHTYLQTIAISEVISEVGMHVFNFLVLENQICFNYAVFACHFGDK